MRVWFAKDGDDHKLALDTFRNGIASGTAQVSAAARCVVVADGICLLVEAS